MSSATLAGISDQLVYLTVLSYLLAAVLFGWEFSFQSGDGRDGGWAGRAGMLVAGAGLAANIGCAVTRGLATGRVPWGNMYEYSIMVGLISVAAFMVWAVRRPEVRPLGGFLLLPAVTAVAVGRFALYADAGPLVPALQSGWLRIHVLAAIIGSSVLGLASIFSVLYLVAERLERRAAPPRPPLVAGGAKTADPVKVRETIAGYVEEETEANAPSGLRIKGRRIPLPSSQVLDDLAYKTTAFGFPIWTFAIIAGAVWAQSAWGRYWGWDPKETWSFIVWTIFAAYLHARATAGWRGRGAAWIGTVGLLAMVFNFYVVNTVVIGLHSYSGL
jgi:cytochrome c-type biogenesis protein CcsB